MRSKLKLKAQQGRIRFKIEMSQVEAVAEFYIQPYTLYATMPLVHRKPIQQFPELVSIQYQTKNRQNKISPQKSS